MDNKLYINIIAFMDDDSGFTNNQYLYEFTKLALYYCGYNELSATEIREYICENIHLDYTEEDIINAIKCSPYNDISFMSEKYSLTSEANREIQRREKNNNIRKFIDSFYDSHENHESIERSQACDLITKFIYEKFREGIDQIESIINPLQNNKLYFSQEYSDEEKNLINGFLLWDNDEKNKMVYNLINKSYDFCTINCPSEISFDFSKFAFYLDANVIMRLLGINNIQRQVVIKKFIKKCKEVGIALKVTSFTKEEVRKSIETQISAINRELNEMGRIPAPQTMEFGMPGSFSSGLYSLYYQYYRETKQRSLNSFQKYFFKEVDNCVSNFEFEEVISYEALNKELFESLSDSLKERKDDQVVKTDINNVLHIAETRKTNKDSFMISADSKLIRWCKDIFIGQNSLVEYPSVWMSVIMKYTGRATSDDYSAFCTFIRLPITIKDTNIEKKIEIKDSVKHMNVSDEIKDRIIDEINHNFPNYVEFTTSDEIAQKAYDAIVEEKVYNARKDERNKYEAEISEIKQKHQTELDKIRKEKESIENAAKEELNEKNIQLTQVEKEGKANSIETRIANWVDNKVNASLRFGRWLQKHRTRVKGILIVLLILIGLIIGIQLSSGKIKNDLSISILDVIKLGGTIVDVLLLIIYDSLVERLNDEVELRKKYDRIAKRKFGQLI